MTTYKPLFILRVVHDYYADGFSPDFTLTPLGRTREVLKRHRLIFKRMPTGAVVASPISVANGAEKPLVEPDDPIHFVFGLVLDNRDFANITDLPVKQKGQIWLFDNATNPLQLERRVVMPTRGLIAAAVATALPAVTFVVTNMSGVEIDRKTVLATDGNAAHQFDLSLVADGLYKLIYEDGQQLSERWYYKGAAVTSLFAMVHVHFGTGRPYDLASPPDFDAVFTSLSRNWRYFVVIKKSPEDISFKIRHSVDNPAVTFGAAEEVDATDDKKTFRIQSETSIPYRQEPISNLKLIGVKPSGRGQAEVDYIENLPNPSPGLSTPDIYVYVNSQKK